MKTSDSVKTYLQEIRSVHLLTKEEEIELARRMEDCHVAIIRKLLETGVLIEEITYEGYGPGGVAVLIEALTDNKNRTAPQIRNFFSKHSGNMGAPGSVAWMFSAKGVICLETAGLKLSMEDVELAAIDAGAEDVKENAGDLTIICAPDNLEFLKKSLEQKSVAIEYAETEKIASTLTKIEDSAVREKLDALYAELDANDEVNEYYTNEE